MSSWWKIALALSIAAPAVVVRLSGAHLAAPVAIRSLWRGGRRLRIPARLGGRGGAARHLGEPRHCDLAVIAVLPEYAVDLYFAWSAGHVPENASTPPRT